MGQERLNEEVEKRESELKKLTLKIKSFDEKMDFGDLQTSRLKNELEKRDKQIKAMILKAEMELRDTDEKFLDLERRKNEEMQAAIQVKEELIKEMELKMKAEIDTANFIRNEELEENARLRQELNNLSKKITNLETQSSITSFQHDQLRHSVMRRDTIIEKLRKTS